MRKTIIIFLILFLSYESFGAISIDRNYIISPLKSPSTTNDIDFLTFSSATAEFGKYLPEPYTDFNHFWIAKAGVFGEMFRYKNKFSITLFSDIELIASSNNIIFFDPRAFYWQEGILISYKENIFNYQLSFTHRCKHDVDNADLVTLYNEVRARIIIWDSIWFRFFPDPIELYNYEDKVKLNILPFIRNDFYVLSVDDIVWYRPYIFTIFTNSSTYRANKIIDSFSFGSIFDVELFKNFGFYTKWYIWFDLIGDKPIWNWSKVEEVIKEHFVEIALYLKGNGVKIFFFLQNNFMREPAIEPFDQGAVNLFHFGIRAVNERFSF